MSAPRASSSKTSLNLHSRLRVSSGRFGVSSEASLECGADADVEHCREHDAARGVATLATASERPCSSTLLPTRTACRLVADKAEQVRDAIGKAELQPLAA
eukprot:6192431-Pleurochrysis_carterae.AAC.4